MDDIEYFIRTIDDLKKKTYQSWSDEYELTQLSNLLFRLLNDGEPLIDKINRKYQLKNIRYLVRDIDTELITQFPATAKILWSVKPRNTIEQMQTWPDYKRTLLIQNGSVMEESFNVWHGGSSGIETLRSMGTKKVKLDKFLSWPTAHISGTSINVREALKYVRNSKGGVHSGKVKEKDSRAQEVEQALDSVSGAFQNGVPVEIRMVRAISLVTLDGIAELYNVACSG